MVLKTRPPSLKTIGEFAAWPSILVCVSISFVRLIVSPPVGLIVLTPTFTVGMLIARLNPVPCSLGVNKPYTSPETIPACIPTHRVGYHAGFCVSPRVFGCGCFNVRISIMELVCQLTDWALQLLWVDLAPICVSLPEILEHM